MLSLRLPKLKLPIFTDECFQRSRPRFVKGPRRTALARKAYKDHEIDIPWSTPDVTTPTISETTKIDKKLLGYGGNEDCLLNFNSSETLKSKYRLIEELGRGTFGVVYSGIELSTGNKVAIKEIELVQGSHTSQSREKRLIQNEVEVMKALQDCPSAVQYRGFHDHGEDGKAYIVMNLCTGGSLDSFSEEHGPVEERQAAFIAAEALAFIGDCHKRRIYHGDVKSGNFVISSPEDKETLLTNPQELQAGWLKGIDFGTCQCLGLGKLSQKVGTPTHWAPEVIGGKFWIEADLWSLGVMIYKLIFSRLPYCTVEEEESLRSERELAMMILQRSPDSEYGPWLDCSLAGQDFLLGLLSSDSQRRLTASEALQHPWVRTHLDGGSTLHSGAQDSCASCYL